MIFDNIGSVMDAVDNSTDDNANNAVSDEVLAQRAAHDVEAFAALYQRYADRIYRYFYSRVRDSHSAEDLTAQTFFALVKGISRYRSTTPFAVYLFTIARYKWHDFLKRPVSVSLDSVEYSLPSALNVEDIIEKKLEVEDLRRHLLTLSSARSEVITLRIFGGLTISEIAQVMHKSEGAIHVLLHRAFSELRKLAVEADI